MGYFSSIYASGLKARAVAVYMYLKDRSDADGTCWPGIRTIGRDLGLSRSTVKRALHDLEHAGYLKRTPRYRENGSSSSNLHILMQPVEDSVPKAEESNP